MSELSEYLESRRKTIEASIAAEKLAGNSVKELCERTALAEITAIEANVNTRNEWIPVSERLPDSWQDVLFYDGTVKKGYFDDFNNIDKTKGKFFWELDPTNFHGCPDNKPTHWQPIRPPKGE